MDEIPLSVYTPAGRGPSIPDNYLAQFLPPSLRDQIRTQLPKDEVNLIEHKKAELQAEIIRIIELKIAEFYDYSHRFVLQQTLNSTSTPTSSSSSPSVLSPGSRSDTPVLGFNPSPSTQSHNESQTLLELSNQSSVATSQESSAIATPKSGSVDLVATDKPPLKSNLVKKARSSSSSSAEESMREKPKKQVSFNLEAEITIFSSDDDQFGDSSTEDDNDDDDTSSSTDDSVISSPNENDIAESINIASDGISITTASTASALFNNEPSFEQIEDVSSPPSQPETEIYSGTAHGSTKEVSDADDSGNGSMNSPPLEAGRINIHSDDDSDDERDHSGDEAVFEFDESLHPETGQSIYPATEEPQVPPEFDSKFASSVKSSIIDPALSMSLPTSNLLSSTVSGPSSFRRPLRKYLVDKSPPVSDSGSDSDSDVENGEAFRSGATIPTSKASKPSSLSDSAHSGSLPINISMHTRRSSLPRSMLNTVGESLVDEEDDDLVQVSARYGDILSDDEMYSPPTKDPMNMSLSQRLLWEDSQKKTPH